MARTASEWFNVLTDVGVREDTARRWSDVFASVVHDGTFSKGDHEIDDFLGQVLHESGKLERIEEGLSYSADRLMAVWPTRFPTIADANLYARNPERLANKVYGGRLGNSISGDGYKFRGRGLIQVTGRDNYRAVGKVLGMDLEANPEALVEPEVALRASIAWWEGNIPDAIMGDIVKVSKRVNGGTTGLADRRELTDKAGEALG